MTKAGQVIWHKRYWIWVLMEDVEWQEEVMVNYKMWDSEWDLLTPVSEITLWLNKTQDD